VRHLALGARITLPTDYVATATELGYATTIHAAQGITADTARTVLTGGETRPLLYVALTRGRAGNHLYLAAAGNGDPHSVIRPEALRPPTAVDTLTTILGHDGAQTSSTTQIRDATGPAVRLGQAVARYRDALTVAAERHTGPQTLQRIDTPAERIRRGSRAHPATRRCGPASLSSPATAWIPSLPSRRPRTDERLPRRRTRPPSSIRDSATPRLSRPGRCPGFPGTAVWPDRQSDLGRIPDRPRLHTHHRAGLGQAAT
jgi:hypothetical protein